MTSLKLRLVPLVVALTAWLWAGCATVQDEGAFDVTLVNISSPRDGGGGVGEAALNFTIRLENATSDAIVVEGGAHRIYLNGIYIGQGLHNERIEVPRFGTVTQDVAVHLSTARLAWSFHRMFQSHVVSYKLTSRVQGAQSGRTKTFKAAKEGTVNVDELTAPASGPLPTGGR
jgi:LEA14-like dessication related protein